MRTIGWGMIGCGDVTEVKNGPGLYMAEHSKLVGITNRTISKAEDWVKRHGHGKVFNSVEALLACDEIEIVYIATTPDKHKDYAEMCAKAGKHCLIEKPLALTYEEGVAIERAFKEADKKAFVAFYRRSLNRFRKIKELIETGAIGKLCGVQITRAEPETEDSAWRLNKDISGGGIFTETDIHILDFLESCLGPIVSYSSEKGAGGNQQISVSMKFENGVAGSGLWLYKCQIPKDEVKFIGEEGIISFPFFNNSEPITVLTNKGEEVFIIEDSKYVGLNMEQEIVNELNNLGKFSGTVSSSLNALKVMESIYNK